MPSHTGKQRRSVDFGRPADAAALRLTGVSKAYGGVAALTEVQFEVAAGEVHALMGENGAGKSTLIKVAAGVVVPEKGSLTIDGKALSFGSPSAARHAGLQVVFQELTVLENLTVAHNLLIDSLPTRLGLVDRRRTVRDAQRILDELGIDIDASLPASSLSVGQKQLVEIARAVSRQPRVLVLDEPTSSLGRDEEEILFRIVRRLRGDGVGVVYVSHRMNEVFDLSDRVTVLRDGHFVDTRATGATTRDDLIRSMVGRDVDEVIHGQSEQGETIFVVQGLTRSTAVRDVDLSLRAGEVVGLAGLMGAGRTEFARLLCGADRPDTGSMTLKGDAYAPSSTRQALAAGVVYVPEDRKTLGLVLGMSIEDNVALPQLRLVSTRGIISAARVTELARTWVERLRIKIGRPGDDVSTLSGGNQQKVALAKWLTTAPTVVLLDEPTRGVDVGAKAEIHEVIRALAREGAAILMISSELPEVLSVSDRILVMARGRLVGELRAAETTEEQILNLAFSDDRTVGGQHD